MFGIEEPIAEATSQQQRELVAGVERLRRELETVRERITGQQEQLVKQREPITEQGKQIGKLEKELSGWRRNSTNSSKPPSSDGMAGPQRAR